MDSVSGQPTAHKYGTNATGGTIEVKDIPLKENGAVVTSLTTLPLYVAHREVEEISKTAFGHFGLLKCEPAKIIFQDDARPYNIATHIRVSFPLLSKGKDELLHMQQKESLRK
ncbi:hypothetical protein CHS0354_037740 [Potamilus streckersoni]|uniref:Uncharacterized protein n=1 Tax=Potamilus streckersoni TaxID=2493646 RepID=A0AAE0W5W1_9BIVA|nr:hypothetical protein CHS0354_037740 [Potamilus streckersoni]